MIFAGIDVNIITHTKALAAGVEAFGLWSWCMCYAQLHETDGRIERVAILSALNEKPRNIRRALVRLLTSGLLVESPDGSFQIHNYGKKNQTADEIRRKKDLAVKRVKRWREGRRNADVTLNVTQGERVRTDPPPEPSPSPSPDNTTRKQDPVIGTASPPPAPVTEIKSRRKPETACPPSDADAAEIRDWSERWKIPSGHGEFQHFLDHHRKSDARWRDWSAAWRTWLKNAPKFGARGGPAPRQLLGDAASAPWMNPVESFDFGVAK